VSKKKSYLAKFFLVDYKKYGVGWSIPLEALRTFALS